jgi:O-antigen/teichoic acid export membrane protein
MWGALAGPLTILLIATQFSKIEQGYYYTFSGLLALQFFFELGLLTVLAQFAAHEFAFLSWGEKGEITGSEEHHDRFVDLLGKGFKWYTVSAALLIIVLVPSGLYFFTQSTAIIIDFTWRLPWTLAVIGVGCNLLLIPFYAVIIGSGDVASINRREMMGGMTGSIIGWIVIASGGGLYAIPAVTTGTIIVGVVYLYKSKPRLVKTAFTSAFGPQRPSHTISWWREVWPMQWKIALSWVSGYFIFQFFTPVLFKFHGPVVAGQMGMTLSIWNAIVATCSTWMAVKAPLFGKLIATKNWRELDVEFFRSLKQSVVVTLIICSLALAVIYALQQYSTLGERLIPAQYVFFMFAALIVQIITNGFATYLRAHKREPFLYLSMFAALLQAVCVLVIGKMFSYQGITIGFAVIIILIFFPLAYLIWIRCRKEWHKV